MNDRIKQMASYLRELESMGVDPLRPETFRQLTDQQRTWLRLKWATVDLDRLTMYQDQQKIPLDQWKNQILSK